jgi:nucleotide-binding universal stress UspA family protein
MVMTVPEPISYDERVWVLNRYDATNPEELEMKEILVLVDASPASQQRVEVAVQYAEKLGAHLTGLFITPDVNIPGFFEKSLFREALQQHEAEVLQRSDKLKTVFMQATSALAAGSDWVLEQGGFSEISIGYSRGADMTIIGQSDPGAVENPATGAPDQVILRSGRPTLVIPYVKVPAVIPAKHVLVAWDGSREAARALHDAIPLLQLAEKVVLFTIAEPKSAAAQYARPDLVLKHLQRYGIAAQGTHLSKSELGIGDMLLNHLVDTGADMLVAGAYGHSRLREVVLGGVTQSLLSHCSIPVMMSR